MKIRLKFKSDKESNLLLRDEYKVIAVHKDVGMVFSMMN